MAPHRRSGFQRCRIDAQCPALHQRGVRQSLQHPREHGLMRLDVNQPPGARQRRMVRRRLVQLEVQKRPNAQRVGGAPGNRPFRIQAFKVAEQQQPEVAAGGQAWPADPVDIERGALGFDEGVKARVVPHTIQPLVKRVPRALRQVGAGDPHRLLPRSTATFAHGHAR